MPVLFRKKQGFLEEKQGPNEATVKNGYDITPFITETGWSLRIL